MPPILAARSRQKASCYGSPVKISAHFSGMGVGRYDRGGEQIVTMRRAAIILSGGLADGEKHRAAFVVDSGGAPGGRRSGLDPIVLRPGFVTGFAGMRDGVERPSKLAGTEIEGADVHRRTVGVVFFALRAGDVEIAIDHARRADVIGGVGKILGDAGAEIDLAGVAESRDALSGFALNRSARA